MISLIIPTLNEGDVIENLVRKIFALGVAGLEVVIVDDGSKDKTREIIKNLQKEFSTLVLIERSERGLATAVLRGFKEAKGNILGVMDADFSHPVELVPKLIDEINIGADIVVASRYVKNGGAEEWPFLRRMYSLSATAIAWPVSRGIKDPMSGFFFLKRKVVESGLNENKFSPQGYKILLEILVKGNWQVGKEVAFIFKNRTAGKSKMGLKVALQYFSHLLSLYFWKATRAMRP